MAHEVIAKRVGLYGGRVRQPGEQFELARKEDMGDWMAPASEADDVARTYERFSSPARAEVGPNEALAYAEAGQLTTALNIQLDALRNENAALHARLAEAEGRLAGWAASNPDSVSVQQVTGISAGGAAAAEQKAEADLAEAAAKSKLLEDRARDADVHASEDEDAVEAKDDAAKDEGDQTRPTRRRRG